MDEALSGTKGHPTYDFGGDQASDFPPLNADRWVVSSLLQKSIRRGETEIAQRAASTLITQKGSAIWRRFMVIAFEDIGFASPSVVAMTVAASTNPEWRKEQGGNKNVAIQLARILAASPKSRSAEHLFTSSQHHPSLARSRLLSRSWSANQCLSVVLDQAVPLAERAVAALAFTRVGASRAESGDSTRLLELLISFEIPRELVTASGIAARKTREPFTLMVPLIWLAAHNSSTGTVTESVVPAATIIDGVSMYALDQHTRLGREAIRRFASENDEVRSILARYVSAPRRKDAGYMAAFYADAAPLASKLVWDGADELEAFGTETDLLVSGVPPEGFFALLAAVRNNLTHLNEVRSLVFAQQHPVASGSQPSSVTE